MTFPLKCFLGGLCLLTSDVQLLTENSKLAKFTTDLNKTSHSWSQESVGHCCDRPHKPPPSRRRVAIMQVLNPNSYRYRDLIPVQATTFREA